ncbi:hypothetical protein [Streptomyces sp. NPDC091383]|uniref:hypothetical protein n=1 Tax=Streptomyces sp. NPDC091383 TaxID=3365996 RepID=UPI00382AC438
MERSAITVPEPLADLLRRVESEIEKLARTTPLAALRAARRLEMIAVQTAYGRPWTSSATPPLSRRPRPWD